MSDKKSVFETLSEIDVSPNTSKKGQFDYLSWANAVREMLKHYPSAEWKHQEWDGLPYQKTEVGYFVACTVEIDGISRKMSLPILDFRNKPVLTGKLTADQVNKAQMRCLTKAIALHGLGLDLWAGEDLMPTPEELALASKRAKLTHTTLTAYIQGCGYTVQQVEQALGTEFSKINLQQAFDAVTSWKQQQS